MKAATAYSLLSTTLALLGGHPRTTVHAFDYNITAIDAQVLADNATQITNLKTIFINDVTLVAVAGLSWDYTGLADGDDGIVWKTYVNGILEAEGFYNLSEVGRALPTEIDVGAIVVGKKQTTTIEVILEIDGYAASISENYQTYAKGVSVIPLLFILFMAMGTQLVELSLFLGILIASCIIYGNLADGFKNTLGVFLVDALADPDHVYVILFTVFLSGSVGMMQKSGGMLGFTRDISRIATTPKTGELACMSVGVLIFFDDYSNVLLAGQTMRPLLDLLSVSREKLSFVVDGTSAPIATISPISSWVGYQVSLIQTQLDILLERYDGDISVKTTGFAVFLQSIKYSYYSFFILILLLVLILMQRDFGPMLVAERRVRVYDRTDGGPNKGKAAELEGDDVNQPQEDQPLYGYNLLIPVTVLVVLIFVLLIETGTIPGEQQTFMEKIENSDSYSALLWGTMATVWISLILYLIQITIPGTGTLVWPTPSVLMAMFPWRSKDENTPRFLLSVPESVEGFLYGAQRIFLAIVVLALAWASGHAMVVVGVDRLFAAFISNGIAAELLPMLTFIIAMLMALATGTSWGTMAILFPLILVPTYEVSGGNPTIFYAVVSAVLGGAVAGDHMSPISDTTVISALACEVTLVAHVYTQAPYVILMVLFAIIFGYLPIGYQAWPNMVGILLGWSFIAIFVHVICVPIISPTGRWDIFTKLCCGRGDTSLAQLSADTIKKAKGETVTASGEGMEEDGHETTDKEGMEEGMDGKGPVHESFVPDTDEEDDIVKLPESASA